MCGDGASSAWDKRCSAGAQVCHMLEEEWRQPEGGRRRAELRLTSADAETLRSLIGWWSVWNVSVLNECCVNEREEAACETEIIHLTIMQVCLKAEKRGAMYNNYNWGQV